MFDPNDLESVDEEDDEDDGAVEDIEEGNFAQIRRKFMNEDDGITYKIIYIISLG